MLSTSEFRPPWWLRNPHLQTIWASALRRRPALPLRRERLELPDHDFLDLDWAGAGAGPVVLILHGLEGSSASGYARGLVHRVNQCGWRALVMHFRGCSGEPNRLARSYHSGETGDLQTVVTWLRQREPETPLAAVGYSLGGNVLLKWLGEQGERAPLTAAVAVSVPFQLAGAAERMQQGFSRVYQWVLLRSLRRNALRKFRDWHPPPVDLARVRRMRSFWSFDDGVTAPLHGFADVHDYYRRASSRQFLAAIRVPTLILQARDDPFMTASVIPSAAELSPATTLELSEHGGHVGFVEARPRWRVGYWLERRIPLYLASKLDPGAGLASVGEPGAERLPHA